MLAVTTGPSSLVTLDQRTSYYLDAGVTLDLGPTPIGVTLATLNGKSGPFMLVRGTLKQSAALYALTGGGTIISAGGKSVDVPIKRTRVQTLSQGTQLWVSQRVIRTFSETLSPQPPPPPPPPQQEYEPPPPPRLNLAAASLLGLVGLGLAAAITHVVAKGRGGRNFSASAVAGYY